MPNDLEPVEGSSARGRSLPTAGADGVRPWVRQLRTLRDQVLRAAREARRDPRTLFRNPWTYLLLGVAVYTALFGTLSDLRYRTFATYAWDLGAYNQAYYSTLYGGRFWFYTADLPSGTGGSLFAVHVAPFLFTLLPLYALAPGPATLLYAQAFGVALGAVPAFALAKWRLGSARWGLLVALVYWALPATQGVNWYDFHPEAFLPVTVLTAIYFLVRRWPRAFLLSFVVALSVEETVAPFLVVFAAVALLGVIWAQRHDPLRDASGRRLERNLLVVALVLSAAWVAGTTALLDALHPSVGAFGSNYGVDWSVLGAPSALEVLPWALLHPGNAWSALLYDADLKLVYAGLLFGSLAFLPWLGEDRYLFPVLFWVVVASLSNTPSFYEFGDQYLAYTLPFLLAGLVGGLAQVRGFALARAARAVRHPPTRPHRGWQRLLPAPPRRAGAALVTLAAVLGVSVLVAASVASPVLTAPVDSYSEITFGIPSVDAEDRAADQVLSLLPAHAGVLTTSPLFPEVSSRDDAYVLPEGSYFAGDATFDGVVQGYLATCPYVFVDFSLDFEGALVLLSAAPLSGYGLRAAVDGAYLYERGWRGPPSLYEPIPASSTAPGDLLPGDAEIDPGLPGPLGPALYHAPGVANGSEMFSGPYVATLPPGNFTVELSVQVAMTSPGAQAGFVVTRVPSQVTTTVLNPSSAGHDYGFSFGYNSSATAAVASLNLSGPAAGSSVLDGEITLSFAWPSPGLLYLQAWALSPSMALTVYGVTISQTSAAGP